MLEGIVAHQNRQRDTVSESMCRADGIGRMDDKSGDGGRRGSIICQFSATGGLFLKKYQNLILNSHRHHHHIPDLSCTIYR